jgi:hypothetical protein
VQKTPAKVHVQRTTPPDSERIALAHGYDLVSSRGRERRVLVVASCPFHCGAGHLHSGKPGVAVAVRASGCGGGKYVVHVIEASA